MADSAVPSRYSERARFVLHPTDFSPESELAFAHALLLALTNKGHLSLLRVGEGDDVQWDRFPAVRKTLERWKLLEPGAQRADIAELGLAVEKLIAHDDDVAHAIAGHLYEHSVDMLVLATHGRRGLSAWLKPSIAEEAARKAATLSDSIS